MCNNHQSSQPRAAVESSCEFQSPSWSQYIRLTLAEDVKLSDRGDGEWELTHHGRNISFRLPSGKLPEVFTRLKEQGWWLSDLLPLLDSGENPENPLSVTEQLQRLWRGGLLIQVLCLNEKPMAVLRASGETPWIPKPIQLAEKLILSEDACIRRSGNSLLLESPESGVIAQFNDPQLFQLVALLACSTSCEEMASCTNLPKDLIIAVAAWLVGIGVADRRVQPDRVDPCGWAFADRLLHARSRHGRHLGGYGGTFPLRGRVAEPSPVRPLYREDRIQLPPIDLESLPALDLPFTTVLEKRCSLRQHNHEPITSAELGEFLYRALRVKKRFRLGTSDFVERRIYPSAGAIYELEFYPLVNHCRGLKPSLYHYDAATHSLEHVSIPTRDTKQMLASAIESSGFVGEPHLLIVITAQFLRINWKYESIAYSLVLKDVGAVYQTMYLVASAMGLAPCALGGGSASNFCRVAGTNYWKESSVGEFLLGRAADTNPGD